MEAAVNYLLESCQKPIAFPSVGGAEVGRNTGQYRARHVTIHDGRAAARPFSLDREGFMLVDHDTAVADFYDQDQIDSVYTAEITRLVRDVTAAGRVLVFDFTVRADAADTRDARRSREPARMIHNDFTPWSARKRLRESLQAAETEHLLRRRFAIVNVWRPILRPVQTAPLAVCDATSVDAGDLIVTERRSNDRIGEILHATYNPGHRWFYFPRMTPTEGAVDQDL